MVGRLCGQQAPVAQLDRALPSEGKGHTFESCRVRQSFQWVRWGFVEPCFPKIGIGKHMGSIWEASWCFLCFVQPLLGMIRGYLQQSMRWIRSSHADYNLVAVHRPLPLVYRMMITGRSWWSGGCLPRSSVHCHPWRVPLRHVTGPSGKFQIPCRHRLKTP